MEKEAAMNPIFTSCATSHFVAGMANKQLVDTSKPWRTQWRWIFFCEGTIHTNSTYVNGGKIYFLHCTEIVFALKYRVVVVLHLIYCLLCTLESWLPPPFWRLWLRPLLTPCQLTHRSVKRHVQISQSLKFREIVQKNKLIRSRYQKGHLLSAVLSASFITWLELPMK